MANGTRKAQRTHQHYYSGTLMTFFWMVPAMALMVAGGFFLAQNVLAKKILKESRVQHDKLAPVRILPLDEAAKLSKDQTSHVWKDGVQDSDIPAPVPVDDTGAAPSASRGYTHHHPRTTKPRVHTPKATPEPTPTDTPVDTPPDIPSAGDTGDATPPDANPPTAPTPNPNE